MKILFAAPLKREITPRITASRPRIIFELISGLAKKGHKISVLGTGDSKIPGAKIIPVIPKSFVNMPPCENPFYRETAYLTKMAKMLERAADGFDVIHNHCYPEFINILVAEKIKRPIMTTVHAQITPELDEAFSFFNNVKNSYLISLSKAHRKLAKKTNFLKVVYNGVDTGLYGFYPKKENYLLWIGRLSKAKDKNGNFLDPKGAKWAIKLAEETKSNLYLSGNIEDFSFFGKEVKPHLSSKIKWIGKLSSEQPLSKTEVAKLMKGAKAFLMTVNWEEPFGLVMAEAQSCGTPVIGFDRGSVKELVVHGKTGFIVPPEEKMNGLVNALKKINSINPFECRKHIERNFSLEKMVDNYEKTYKEILKK